jgi:hypothetical protein
LYRWLLEVGPLVWVMASLCVKLVYFNVLLRAVWLAPEEPLGRWIDAHLSVLSATLASLMLLAGLLLLVPQIWRLIILLALNLLLTSLVVADMVHMRFYGDVSSILELSNRH